MSDLFLSIFFCILCYVSAGYAFKTIFKVPNINFSEGLFLGGGLIVSVSLFVSMLLPDCLYATSISLMVIGLLSGMLSVVWVRRNSDHFLKLKTKRVFFYVTLFVCLLPILIGTFNVRLWGDELNFEAPMVRFWLKSGDFFADPDKMILTLYEYPRVWVLMIFQSLCLKGEMHEAAGRWLNAFIILAGAAFVWKEYVNRLNLDKWVSLIWASLWMALVFGPMFAHSASWYYSIIISILVMLSFYYTILARSERDGSLDLKLVSVSSILMAMIVGIRPDGFLYVPLSILLLFVVPIKKFWETAGRNVVASLIVLVPSGIMFFGWRFYVKILNIPLSGDHIATSLGRMGELGSKVLPVTFKLFEKIVTEWDRSGVWFVSLALCCILSMNLYKKLDGRERRILLLLIVPVYKFVLMIFESALFYEDIRGRMGRHIMQTAPILYFLLGFLLIKWLGANFGSFWANRTSRAKVVVFSGAFGIVFGMHLIVGALFACLPGEMNTHMESWADLIKREYSEYGRVQLLYSGSAPKTTRVGPLLRYYVTSEPDVWTRFATKLKNIPGNVQNKSEYLELLHAESIDAVLVYGADDEIRRMTELELVENASYLLKVGQENFRIVGFKGIPYCDIWVVPWRTKAIQRVVEGLGGCPRMRYSFQDQERRKL